MGHLINPVSFRLGVNRFWDNKIVSYKFRTNDNLNLLKVNLNSFLDRFFNFKLFLKYGFLYSHNNVMLNNEGLILNIYIYKTINNPNKSMLELLFLIKIFNNKVRLKFYKKIISLLNYYFSEIFLKFSLKKNHKQSNIKNLNYFYMLFQLKKFRFFSIEKFIQINLKKNMRNEEYLNFFYERLFFMLIRKRFWNILAKFLSFYIKPYVLGPVKINFYSTSELSIDVVKKFIIIRLQQRFKVSQIIVPIMKNLKENKSVLGFKFSFSGRFSRREMATYEWFVDGAVPLNTINAKIEYKQFPVLLKDGICGIKVWINRKLDYEDNIVDCFAILKKENLIYKV
jgi:hypothetical protein